jgi:hypothetical protein
MARATRSKSSIWAGKASRKKPEMRKVTSTRGRARRASGMISKPVTRQLVVSQVGLAPTSAMAWAMSSPPVRMFDVPQADRPSAVGNSPWSWKWRSTSAAAEASPSAQAVGVGTARLSME